MYGVPGKLTRAEIVDRVEWLLQSGRFKYGSMDVKVCDHLLFFSILIVFILETHLR